MRDDSVIKYSAIFVSLSGLFTVLFSAYIAVKVVEELDLLEQDFGADYSEFLTASEGAWDVLKRTRIQHGVEGVVRQKRHSHSRSGFSSFFEGVTESRSSSSQCNCGTRASNCPPGPQGPPGDDGYVGEPGSPGEPGRPGAPGVSLIYEQERPGCILCPVGNPGEIGPPGLPGYPGPPGENGRPGSSGNDGLPGPVGPPGDAGIKGQPGDDGRPGGPGVDGIRGGIGLPGEPGQRGRQGQPGEPGRSGNNAPPGQPGPGGPQGPVGPMGNPGQPGQMGPPGGRGAPGPDSNYCACPQRSSGVVRPGVNNPSSYATSQNLYDRASFRKHLFNKMLRAKFRKHA